MQKILVLTLMGLGLGTAHAQDNPPANPIDQHPAATPPSVEKGILPMSKILATGRAKRAMGIDIDASTRDGVLRANLLPRLGTRVYVMTAQGLQLVKLRPGGQSALRIPMGDENPQADIDDGKEVTAYENIGSPLDPALLARFRLCKSSRTEQGISDLNTFWMSALSAVAYLKYPLAFDRFKQMGFDQIYFMEGASDTELVVAKILPKKDANGNIIKDSGLSVVAFRGTDKPEDWLTNLNATTQDISGHNNEAWVHEGFALALDEVYGEILKALDLGNNPSPLFITGHSLGGALATEMALRLISKESESAPPVIGPNDDRLRGLYVFAVPRVGNMWARNILDKYMNRTRNVAAMIHSNTDPAPKVPFDWMGYKRMGVQTIIPYDASDESDYANRGAWVCHADADYAGPSVFSLEFLHSSVEAHHMESYAKHFAPWRNRLDQMSCDDASPTWGPRFAEENPTGYRPLHTAQSLGKSDCDYTALSWGGVIQL